MNEESPGKSFSKLPGQLLKDRYQIIKPIGRGAMGDVLSARDTRLDRDVAVKLLKEEYTKDQALRARFEREARAAGRLSRHANIVTVYDVDETEEMPFIVMELVTGGTLSTRMKSAPFSVEEAVQITMQILDALSFAHQNGIYHRDIKPSNILISDSGEMKVGDFGIATVFDGVDSSDLTLTSQVIGTPAYLSPERVQNKVITPSSDLFSVGVILYEMLTGTKPFKGDNPLSVVLAARDGIYERPENLNPKIPSSVLEVISRALAPLPENRYSSALHMSAALDADATLQDTAPIDSSDDDNTQLATSFPTDEILGKDRLENDDPTMLASGRQLLGDSSVRQQEFLFAGFPKGLMAAVSRGFTKDSLKSPQKDNSKRNLIGLVVAALIAFLIVFMLLSNGSSSKNNRPPTDTTVAPTTSIVTTTTTPPTTTTAVPTTTTASTGPPGPQPPGQKKKLH